MPDDSYSRHERNYFLSLTTWCEAAPRASLGEAAALALAFLKDGLSPQEIVSVHRAAVERALRPHDARGLIRAQQFLLDVMIAYGSEQTARSQLLLAHTKSAVIREHERAIAAELASREHFELLANISHELGTPLTVVKGNIAALRKYRHPTDLLPSEVAVREADIDAALERMVRLREQLMVAHLDELALELAPRLLDRVAARATRWAEPAALEKGLSLTFVAGTDQATISADDQGLYSIIDNLLSNAIRYTPTGGRIVVSTRSDASTVSLSIADSGIGLSDEARARVFDRFYRSPEAKAMSAFGLGLGLSLTKGLVEAMGASIALESRTGVGSTFTVVFPRLEAIGDATAGEFARRPVSALLTSASVPATIAQVESEPARAACPTAAR